MSNLVTNTNTEEFAISTGLTPKLSNMRTRSSSGGGAPSSSGGGASHRRTSSGGDAIAAALGDSSGGTPKSPKKRTHDEISKADDYEANKEDDYEADKEDNSDTNEDEDSEITIPAGFNILNFKTVRKFIDNLNPSQLQVILDRQYIIRTGDIQEDRIKVYFKTACRAKGVRKTKKKKPSKIVKKWTFSDEE